MQDSRTEQVVKYQIQTKRQTSHTRYTIKKRNKCYIKKERQTKPVYHHEHANTNHTPERRITPQKEKRKITRHIPASPASITPRPQPTQTHIQSSSTPHTHTPAFIIPTPYPHTVHTPTDTCYHPLTTYCPLLLHHHLCLYYMPLPYHRLPAPCPQLHLCLSRSRYRSPSTCVPLPDGRYAMPPPAIYHAHLYRYHPDCCLHTVHIPVCTNALVCYSTMPTVLGSAPVLTTIHHSHLLCVTPAACATTSPLRESTLTPCRFHHPYRSLTLAHRVVPPLVVPVPSLAVLLSACPWWFPLLVSLRSLTLAYRLTPMVTCCSLSARPHIMHHYLPASPLVRIHVSILFSCLSARLLTLLCSVFHPVLPA